MAGVLVSSVALGRARFVVSLDCDRGFAHTLFVVRDLDQCFPEAVGRLSLDPVVGVTV